MPADSAGWMAGWLEGWMAGGLDGWRVGGLDGWMAGGLARRFGGLKYMNITKKQIEDILDTIPDPEIGISILQLGLVYDIQITEENQTVNIIMTLTSIGCPLFDQIAGPIRKNIMESDPEIKDVKIDLTFEPPWSPDKMSEEAKLHLGF